MPSRPARQSKIASLKKRAEDLKKKGRNIRSHVQVPSHRNDYEQKILEPEEKKILQCLRRGGSINDAAKLVGVSGRLLRKKKAKYPDFALEIERARVIGKMHHLSKIYKGSKEWRASAWLLERMFYQEFGARTPDSFTKDQVLFLVMKLTQIVNDKVKDTKTRQAINADVQALVETFRSEPVNLHGKKDEEDE